MQLLHVNGIIIASFLCTHACHHYSSRDVWYRWCFTLDRGYLWKALLSREVQRAEMARRREAASRLHVALPPKSVSIALNGVQQKGVPNKDVIFALCQKSIQKQVMQVITLMINAPIVLLLTRHVI